MHDIAYILREDIEGDELRHSLRSLENFPHGKVWFFGGCPKWGEPDEYVKFKQIGDDKSKKATSTFKAICESDISDSFWLFNDDFFIMEPMDDLPYMYHKEPLAEHAQTLLDKSPWSTYAPRLQKASQELQRAGYGELNYELHVPMLFDKTKALEAFRRFNSPMIRSLYGNYHNVGGIEAEDVKIYSLARGRYDLYKLLSTNDTTFKAGAVGSYIRKQFKKKSRYEK